MLILYSFNFKKRKDNLKNKSKLMFNIQQYKDYPLIEGPLKLEDIKILYGANYFCGDPVIRFRVNLCEYDEVFSDEISNLYEKLIEYIPSLREHFCSVGKAGGFLLRVKEGTLLGHIMEHVTIEIQSLAGMDAGFGKTRMTKIQGVYNVVFRFLDTVAGIYAGKVAFNFLNSILTNQEFDLQEAINNLILIREKRLLGPSTQAIVDEAYDRKIPYLRLNKYNRVQLGTGKYRKVIRATVTSDTSYIGVETADYKYLTNSILEEAGIPVPKRILCVNPEEIIEFQEKLQKPIVIKPSIGSRGKRISIELSEKEKIGKAFDWASEYTTEVIAQEFILGNTFRLLIVDNKFVAAVCLEAPYIIGDGKNNIKQLIDKLNLDPRREFGDKGKLTKVEIDEDTLKIIELEDLDLQSIPKENRRIYLKNSGSLRLGGCATDVTDKVHDFNKFIAERVCKTINLNVGGVDIITTDISTPINQNNGKIIEVNAAPDFRMHLKPTVGQRQDVQKKFVDMLFPEGNPSRIPLYSISGSKGKSLCAELIDNCLRKTKNYCNGVVSKKGLFIDQIPLKHGDMTDSPNVNILLKDTSLDCAIVETTVEAILSSGLGYEFADFGIVLNINEEKDEYYEYDHIRDIEDVSYAKSVVAEQVYDEGYTILNADNEFIYEMKERLYSKLALFSRNPKNSHIKIHVTRGGIATVIQDGGILIRDGISKYPVILLEEIPLQINENEEYKYDSLLASVTALYLSGVSIEEIKEFLSTYPEEVITENLV